MDTEHTAPDAHTTQADRTTVVICINDFRVGGAQKLIADILQNIDYAAFSVHLVVLMQYEGQASFYELVPDQVTVHKLHFTSFRDLKNWRHFFRLLRHVRPDVVWSNLYFSNTVSRVATLFQRYPIIVTEHNTYLNRTVLQKIVDRILALWTYKIVAVSQFVYEHTHECRNIPKAKLEVIHNGVAVSKLQTAVEAVKPIAVKNQLGFTESDRVLINIGQCTKQKNQELLIDAFAQFVIQNPNYKLVILGEGTLLPTLQTQVENLNLTDSVKLLGVQKNVVSFLATADFFVLSSRFEGLPIVAVEAIACGLPIISTPVSGTDEYLDDGKNGYLAEPTVADLSAKMSQLAQLSADEYAAFEARSKQMAEQFDVATTTLRYQELFLESIR